MHASLMRSYWTVVEKTTGDNSERLSIDFRLIEHVFAPTTARATDDTFRGRVNSPLVY